MILDQLETISPRGVHFQTVLITFSAPVRKPLTFSLPTRSASVMLVHVPLMIGNAVPDHQSVTALIAVLIPAHAPLMIAWPVLVCVKKYVRPATSPATATIIRPIGLAAMTTLSTV